MRLDTWENTVLIYSTVIHAGHQTGVKSCWKALKLGNNIGSRAKPAVLFLRLRAPFQNYCLLFSSSLVFKRGPFNTKICHDLIYFMLPWSLLSSFFSTYPSISFCFLPETWRIWVSLSPKIVIIGLRIKQLLLVNSSHRTNTPSTKPKAPSSNRSPFWQPVPLIPLYPEQTTNLLPWTLLTTSSA